MIKRWCPRDRAPRSNGGRLGRESDELSPPREIRVKPARGGGEENGGRNSVKGRTEIKEDGESESVPISRCGEGM